MAQKFVCQRCAYTVVLAVGRYIICPKCGGAMANLEDLTAPTVVSSEMGKVPADIGEHRND